MLPVIILYECNLLSKRIFVCLHFYSLEVYNCFKFSHNAFRVKCTIFSVYYYFTCY